MLKIANHSLREKVNHQAQYAYQCGSAQLLVYGKKQLQHLRQVCPQTEHIELLDNILWQEKQYLARQTGLDASRILFLKQVHGKDCHFITQEKLNAKTVFATNGSQLEKLHYAEGDGFCTNLSNVLLVIRSADCLPVFIVLNLETKGVHTSIGAAIHAGWRGLKSKIVFHSMNQIMAKFCITEKDIESLSVHFLCAPCAGAQEYEISSELADSFSHVRKASEPKKGFLLDMIAEAKDQIKFALRDYAEKNKLNAKQLLDCLRYNPALEGCTMNQNQYFFSHRRGDLGRNLNGLWLSVR